MQQKLSLPAASVSNFKNLRPVLIIIVPKGHTLGVLKLTVRGVSGQKQCGRTRGLGGILMAILGSDD